MPLFKDWNEVQMRREEITDGKYLREAVYGLKELQPEKTVEIIRMSEVDTQAVEWLWEPYIPFFKVTIVQGSPGEGKSTFALRLAAACTAGKTLPNMKPLPPPPFNVIYQTAEDGLGDTVKPRLMEADTDLDRVLVIDEAKQELTLFNQRIETPYRRVYGRKIAFCLDPETGFEWLGEYDITADELLSGAGGNTATKTEQAERLLLDLLTGGKELLSEDVLKAAAEAGISERTLNNARRNLDSRIAVIRRGNQWYYRLAETKSAKHRAIALLHPCFPQLK